MDTSAEINTELLKETIGRKKQGGHRCLGKQRDGNYALCVGLPTGTFTSAQLSKLSAVVEKYAKAGHLSTAQSLIIVGIQEKDYYPARQAVLESGFEVRSIGRDVRQVKCCPGADFSPFGLQRTLPMGSMLEEAFRGLPTPMKFKISVSGCPNCCANTKMNDFGIHGHKEGWKIFIGGKMGNTPVIARELGPVVSTDDVPKYLAAVLRTYRDNAEENERLATTIERIGFEAFAGEVGDQIVIPYSDLTAEAEEARETAERSHCIGHLGNE